MATSSTAILDTSALVAFFSRSDQLHLWAISAFKDLPPALITCEAVISETLFLLRRAPQGLPQLSDMVTSGVLEIRTMHERYREVFALLLKYRDIPMSYADGCLVCLAEMLPNSIVVTADSDFATYRLNRNRKIPLMLAKA